jgi:hypothetical protein
MTFQTILICHALSVEHVPDFMGLVAIDARRKYMLLFFPQLSFDHFSMDRFDLGMALGTCRGNISARNGRSGIRMRKDGMRCMATCAIRRNDKPLMKEPLPMNAFGKMLKDLVLVNVPIPLNRRPFPVAFCARERKL